MCENAMQFLSVNVMHPDAALISTFCFDLTGVVTLVNMLQNVMLINKGIAHANENGT